LTHRIALKANGRSEAAETVAPGITDFTVEPAEFVAVTANRSFLLAAEAGTTKLWLSKPAITEQVEGTGVLAVTVAEVGQEYHL
jgi:hypothetical protein